MDCGQVVFSGHAVQRMFERGIGRGAVLTVIAQGETIADYPEDSPYPSRLLLGFVEAKALHVVLAFDKAANVCIVITAYAPAVEQWNADFRTRKVK
ncbi:MAG TPA: DUF4258 domain-containing protein [Bryobacteraceae bacterium]|nr:DUF4258 domain-containing protein [Bryobacteraceae bacterium]